MRVLKYILFACFFLVLLTEQLQFFYKRIYPQPLQGVTIPVNKPKLTADNWISGRFQEQFMKHYEQNLVLHPWLIRLRNQISYSIFDEINTGEIEEGKNNFLYERGYIESYLGKTATSEDVLVQKALKLAYVQQELKKHNVDLIFLIAPGKPSILPEYLPSKYDQIKKEKNNYDVFSEQLKKQKINHIDITDYFLKLKPTINHPLFTKCGVHWSMYGSTLAADTLFSYMEKIRNIDLPERFVVGGKESFIPLSTDADLGELMNLMKDPPSDKMYYPYIFFQKNSKNVKPNVLFIGDSFIWSWFGFYDYIPNMCNDKSAYWYYNHEIGWSLQIPSKTLITDLDLKEQTLQRDFIVIETNEYGLGNPGYLFIDKMFDLMHAQEDSAK